MYLISKCEYELMDKALKIMPLTTFAKIINQQEILWKFKKKKYKINHVCYKKFDKNFNLYSLGNFLNINIQFKSLSSFINDLTKSTFKIEKYFYSQTGKRFLDELFLQTKFLENVDLKERIFCFNNNLKKVDVVCFCGKKKSFNHEYSKTCGSSTCISVISIETKKQRIDPITGFNMNKISAIKAANTMKIKQKDGRTIREKASIKLKKTLNKVVENDLTIAQIRGKKVSKAINKICENGKTVIENRNIKNANKRKTTFINGKSLYQISAKKGIETKIKNFKWHKKYSKKSDLYIQSKLEEKFLDLVYDLNLIDDIKRGPKFLYYLNKEKKYYLSDFIFPKLNIIFEIKSKWSYDRFGRDLEIRKINNLKWKTVIEEDYEFFVIWDNKFISKYRFNDFKNKRNDLSNTDYLHVFNDNVLLDKLGAK